jgi:hypothetical protein
MKKLLILIFCFSTIHLFSQVYSENQLTANWKGKVMSLNLYHDKTFKMKAKSHTVVGNWELEGANNNIITFSYSGMQLDTRLQVISLIDDQLEVMDNSNDIYYSFTKVIDNSYSLSSNERSILFWGGLMTLFFLGSDSGSTPGEYKGTYSNDPAVDRYMINAAEEDHYRLYNNN